MTDDQIVPTKMHVSALVLANIAEVTAVVMKNVAGNDISNALNGETLTKDMQTQLAMSVAVSDVVQNGIPAL